MRLAYQWGLEPCSMMSCPVPQKQRIQPSMRSPDSGAESFERMHLGAFWYIYIYIWHNSLSIYLYIIYIYVYIHAYSGAGTSIFHSHDIHAAPGTMRCRIRRHGGNKSPVPGMEYKGWWMIDEWWWWIIKWNMMIQNSWWWRWWWWCWWWWWWRGRRWQWRWQWRWWWWRWWRHAWIYIYNDNGLY